MRRIISIVILMGLMGCESGDGFPVDIAICDQELPEDTERENVLVIGDSISWGYLPTVQASFPDLDVVHNPCNARSSRNGVINIDSWLAKRERWALVTFNHGLWDTRKSVPMTTELYRQNIREIALKIQAKSDRAIFFTTTVIPENEPYRHVGFEEELNQVAIEVMAELGIPVYDLNAESKGIMHLMLNQKYMNDVHYEPEGYAILGEFVSEAIASEML